MEGIYKLAQQMVDEGAAIVKRDKKGNLGVLFKDEGEFIPFDDLGYNQEYGFYRLSSLPDVANESHKPKIEETFFTSGRITDFDGYQMWAILPTDLTNGFIIGSWDSVLRVHSLLDRLIKAGGLPDEEISQRDERLGHKWLTVSDAAQKYNVSTDTVRRACREGKIKEAEQVEAGGMWRFPENNFRAWYVRKYQPEKNPHK